MMVPEQWSWTGLAFAGGVLLAAAITLVDGYRRHRADQALRLRLQQILGYGNGPLPLLIQTLEWAVRDAGVCYQQRDAGPAVEWTVKTWRERWLEVLHDHNLRPLWVASALLENEGDQRDLGGFVSQSIRLEKDLYRLLAGDAKSTATPWSQSVRELVAIISDASRRTTAPSPGLLVDLEQARKGQESVANELAQAQSGWQQAQKTIEAVSPLLIACGIDAAAAEPAAVKVAADNVAMLLLVAREAAWPAPSGGETGLAEALDRRLRELRAESAGYGEQLAEVRRQLAEAQSAVVESTKERDSSKQFERAADALMERLELTRFRNEVNPDAALAQHLQGNLWTLRLVLLAAREAWTAAAAGVEADLAAFLRIAEVPAHCLASLVAVERVTALDAQPSHSIVFDQVAELCRLFDATARVSEFRRTYQLQELDSLEAWAHLVATAVEHCLARRGIQLRRPPLLQPGNDFRNFDRPYGDEKMPSFPAIRKRVVEELDRGNDGFVIDVTQSEVIIDGVIRRIGVLSCVSPHRWRT